MDYLAAFISAFIYIFVIIDPFVSVPIFVSLTRKFTEDEIRHAARDAVLIAGAIAFVFLFAGDVIISLLRIDMSSFRIAGGIVLGLLGLETVLGIKQKSKVDERTAVATLIATPMLTGPGLITTLILMAKEIGYEIPFFATVLALIASWFVLENASRIRKLLGGQTIEIVAKVFGLFLVAIGISFIRGGLGI